MRRCDHLDITSVVQNCTTTKSTCKSKSKTCPLARTTRPFSRGGGSTQPPPLLLNTLASPTAATTPHTVTPLLLLLHYSNCVSRALTPRNIYSNTCLQRVMRLGNPSRVTLAVSTPPVHSRAVIHCFRHLYIKCKGEIHGSLARSQVDLRCLLHLG